MNKSYKFTELLIDAWKDLRLYSGQLFGAAIVLFVLNLASRACHASSSDPANSFGSAAEWACDLISLWVSLGWMRMLLAIVDKAEPLTAMLFTSPLRQFIRYLLAIAATVAIVVVPAVLVDTLLSSAEGASDGTALVYYTLALSLTLGIAYVLMRLAMLPFVLVDKDCSTEVAVRTTWNATHGHVRSIIGLALVFVLLLTVSVAPIVFTASSINDIALLLLGIIPFIFTMYSLIALAFANLYRKMIPREQTQIALSTEPPVPVPDKEYN